MTSAGTGIRHSEKAHGEKEVHFLQIWSLPSQSGLSPQYFTRYVFDLLSRVCLALNIIYRHFSDAEKRDKWAKVVAPAGSEGVVQKREATGPAPVHSGLSMFASLLSPSTTLKHTLPAGLTPRKAYFHVIQTSGYNPGKPSGAQVKLSAGGEELVLREGDGVYIMGEAGATLEVKNDGEKVAEVILFDLE